MPSHAEHPPGARARLNEQAVSFAAMLLHKHRSALTESDLLAAANHAAQIGDARTARLLNALVAFPELRHLYCETLPEESGPDSEANSA